MDLGHEVSESVALDTPKTALVDSWNSSTKISPPEESLLGWFDLQRSNKDLGHEEIECCAYTPKNTLVIAENAILKSMHIDFPECY